MYIYIYIRVLDPTNQDKDLTSSTIMSLHNHTKLSS